ncbi:MAG: hypothetical protein KC423_22120 [Anaerolineales bacterium]|nr:hypothetical protein [Anaerolineales bacterium]MCA9966969.1 hypothetical protein [Anaerolineales bacterium]
MSEADLPHGSDKQRLATVATHQHIDERERGLEALETAVSSTNRKRGAKNEYSNRQ